jgi:hypothetical protein
MGKSLNCHQKGGLGGPEKGFVINHEAEAVSCYESPPVPLFRQNPGDHGYCRRNSSRIYTKFTLAIT